MHVLLVEDDDRVGLALTDILLRHNLSVQRVNTAVDAVTAMSPDVDVVVLDLGLPDHDGFALLARLRRENNVPVVIATARGDLESRIHGLHLGADDYVVKPYESLELLARLHAVHRRAHPAHPAVPAQPGEPPGQSVHLMGGIAIDRARQTVHVGEHEVNLSPKEFSVLALLSSQPGVVFRREQILSIVWQSQWKADGRTLEVHVASLRAKLGVPEAIETVRRVGYRLRCS